MCFRSLSAFLFGVLGALAASPASAQTYSIDFHGPMMGLPDSNTFTQITEGDILTPGMPVPGIVISGGAAGLGIPAHAAAVGHPPGAPGFVEVDALSYGDDQLVEDDDQDWIWHFSVDEFATGLVPVPPGLNVTFQGAGTAQQAAADIYRSLPAVVGPGPVSMGPGSNALEFEGDGVFPPGYPSLALFDGNPPAPGVPDMGDNVDAIDVDATPAFPVYFSLDSGFGDFLEGIPNSGSAGAVFSGSDVLVTSAPGAAPVVYAPAADLGLDLAGPGTDDLDALILHESGDGVFKPSQSKYDWLSGASDMLFFSVRRGSAIVGAPDSYRGMAIMPGDVLFPFGPAGTPPGIWIPAERLGLCTARCVPCACGFADDLNALDVTTVSEFVRGDCDSSGTLDISDAASLADHLNNGTRPDCEDACDHNDDGVLSGLDVQFLLIHFFVGGPPPPNPFPLCGSDPTPDALGCASFAACP